MDVYATLVSLAVALGVGFIIGLERQQSAPSGEGSLEQRIGGVRTYPLYTLVGGVSVLMAQAVGPWIVVAAFVSVMAFPVLSYLDDLRASRERGVTSELAYAVAFLLGALALTQEIITPLADKLIVVSATGVAVTALLSAKPVLHGMIEKTSREDVYSTLKFLIVAVIVLPLLPNQTFGPLDVLNPFSIGLMIVLIAGISFAGYISVRIWGAGRGIGLTAVLGGLVSSTAVTLSFSRRARTDPALAKLCAVAVVGASSIMFPRVLLEVAVVNPSLVAHVAIPVGAMAVAGAIASLVLYRLSRTSKETPGAEAIKLTNPFELGSAVKFGLLFGVVLFVSKAATVYLGSSGTYVAGVLAGTTDVDAITLSMASLAREGLSERVAATTIMLGAVSNTIVKAGLAIGIGGWAFGRRVAVAFLLVFAAGVVGLLPLWLR